MTSFDETTKKIGVLLLSTTLVVALAAALVLAIDLILLIFLGILFGVFLTKVSELLERAIPLGYRWRLAIVVMLLLVIAGGAITLFGNKVESRLSLASQRLDESTDKLGDWLSRHPVAKNAVGKLPFVGQSISDGRPAETTRTSHPGDHSASPDKSHRDSTSGTSGGGKDASDGSNSSDPSTPTPLARLANASSMSTSAAGRLFSAVGRMMSTTLGFIANVGLILFVGVFLAVDPQIYQKGFAKLYPIDKRDRVIEVTDKLSETLFNWLNGRLLSMLITGVGTAMVLWMLNVPMAITLGVVTGLLTFIPNIGAIIAVALAMLMAISQGPLTVLWVVVAYGILQLIESNLITPLVQQHQTSIPPALLISFQVVMGALTGFLGLMVATPLLAAAMVVVKEVWIKDTLNDRSVD